MRRVPLLVPLLASGLLALSLVALPASASSGTTATGTLPTVTGAYGTRPKLTFPKSPDPKRLEVKVLHRGTGAPVPKGDLLVCNYYGQIWRGKVFDTSFGRGLFATPIGVGKVIPGWDEKLPGLHVGSRVLLVVPPKEGYGKSGNAAAGITGKDTLVFVIDLVGAYSKSVHGDPHATVLKRVVNGVHVSGSTGGKPTVSVKGAPRPKKVSVTLIARGHGPKITPGLVVDQYVAAAWSGPNPPSTWASGVPDGETVGDKSQPSALDAVVGMPLGSRVLLEAPKTTEGGPYAVVFDLVAEPRS